MSEFAPEYTKPEKLRIFALHLAWAIPVFIIAKFWLMPWFDEYADRAHCYDYGFVTGTQLVLYAGFVGIPISFALIIFAFEGIRSLRVIRLGQNPLPGEKVFRTTKYKYGVRARVQPVIVLLLFAALLGLSVKGMFSVDEIAAEIDSPRGDCLN